MHTTDFATRVIPNVAIPTGSNNATYDRMCVSGASGSISDRVHMCLAVHVYTNARCKSKTLHRNLLEPMEEPSSINLHCNGPRSLNVGARVVVTADVGETLAAQDFPIAPGPRTAPT